MIILTAIDAVRIQYGTENEKTLGKISCAELKQYYDAGEFSQGSMGPKVEAAINFIEGGGKRAVIAHLEDADRALRGECGTQLTADRV